jgi:hypothetical protein
VSGFVEAFDPNFVFINRGPVNPLVRILERISQILPNGVINLSWHPLADSNSSDQPEVYVDFIKLRIATPFPNNPKFVFASVWPPFRERDAVNVDAAGLHFTHLFVFYDIEANAGTRL